MKRDHAAWTALLAGEPLPAALVDLDAFDHNLALLTELACATGRTVRVASKSVRVPALLERALAQPGVAGLMTWSVREMAWLAEQGFDDMVAGYPVARPDEAALFGDLAARGTRAVAMVDHPDQVDLLARAGLMARAEIPLCIDVDASWRPAASLHFGARRSPLRNGRAVGSLAAHIAAAEGVRLVGLMAYEAQVAGIRDANPGKRLLDPVLGLIKARSIPLAAARRAEAKAAVEATGQSLDFVNGGGTGSVLSTREDPAVTEITVGSGFLCSHLFDGYRDIPLQPAAFFALAVVRASDPGFLTCAGGGYIASGAPGPDRLPIVHSPPGLCPVDLEGFGEVQTPLRLPSGTSLSLGSPVICRHAKAGELFERFDNVLLVGEDRAPTRVPTYRGLGGCFP